MNPNPWGIAVNVFAIVIYLFCTLAIGVASVALLWSLRNIDRTLAPAMAALVGIEKPLVKMVETLDGVSAVASELKELKEGDLRIIQAQVKSVGELRLAIEEFHGALFAPAPEKAQRRRGASGVDEQAEIVAEQRAAEKNGNQPDLAEFLEQRGKHGGVV